MSAANNLQIKPRSVHPVSPTSRDPKVRTLKAPPEIWDLVHETRAEFKPGSAFVAHLRALHPLTLALMLILVGGGSVFGFMQLRSWSASNTAAPPVAAGTSNAKTVLSPPPTLPNRTESSSAQPINNAPAPTDTTAHTIDEARTVVATPVASTETAVIKIAEPKVNVAAPAASSATKVIAKPRPQNPTSPTTPTGEKVAARNKDKAQASNIPSVNTRTDNKDIGKAAPAPKTENEKAAYVPAAKKEADKPASPQLIAPARANSTPKAKVIAWP